MSFPSILTLSLFRKLLITFSPEEIKKAGHMALTILAVTDEAGVKKIHFHTGIHATAGETVIADFE